ncbi:hypothetical protein B0F90DRAFT_1643375, partial [Multifurca ochricompacta]
PSRAALISEYIKQQAKLPILNGCPFGCYAPPIGLFHPVFNSFQEVLASQDPLNLDDGASRDRSTRYMAFANLYKNETDRLKAIHAPLNALLGGALERVSQTGVTADGLVIEACCGSTAYIAILEMKNEMGTAHIDPFIQAGLSYRRQVIRECSYCPTIILAIAGPWMCVSGAIYLEKVVVQPLTGYIWLGGSFFDKDQIHFTLRLFTALKLAISTLRSYYLTLGPTNKCPEDLVHAIPYVTPSFASTLTYISRPSPDQQSKLVYKAKFIHAGSSRPAVVKFVSRYNAKAHRILAAHQLAPTLYHTGTEDVDTSKYGGLHMVIMDFIEGKHPDGTLSSDQYQKVKKAIDLLHGHGFVFGDLQTPNILINGENVILIDFDWGGKAGGSQYPVTINLDPRIGWPEGVGPDSVMEMVHDQLMLEQLKPPSRDR